MSYMFYRYLRYPDFVDDVSHAIHDMSPDSLLRRLRFASDMHLLPDGGNDGEVNLLTVITHFTQAVKTVSDNLSPRDTDREVARRSAA
jgi:hypothetical protein